MTYYISELIRAVKMEAKEREVNAAQAGEHGDRGASNLLMQTEWYEKGLNNEYPIEWEKYSKHIDDEYEEYLRLKNKFDK